MNKSARLAWSVLLSLMLVIGGLFAWIYYAPKTPTLPERPVEAMQLTESGSTEVKNVSAQKIPEFDVDISAPKYAEILIADDKKIATVATAAITNYSGMNPSAVDTDVTIDKEAKKLSVKPKFAQSSKPGMYKLHLTLRTLEGDVTIEQDFTWGVIAINTNKSVYQPGDSALISMGVLNDAGETQCMTGKDTAKVWLTIIDPTGSKKEYTTEDNSIRDSGECGPTTVTNKADFQALYLVSTPGNHTMTVTAEVNKVKRTITDTFTVQAEVPFIIERSNFPTRIYPGAPYPVTFTVSAKESYSGTVEEIVPANFQISGISDGGKVVEEKFFKKIIWEAALQPKKDTSYGYTITFPMVSPEFYLLGPITIGAFKEARQWQVASDAINSTSGLAAWEDNGGPNTYSRVWTGTTWNPALGTTPTSMDSSPADGRWFKEVSSPKTGEKLVAVGDNVNPDDIYMFWWSGSAWTEEFKIDLAVNGWDTTRGFDLAYEEESGEALFVYSDGADGQLFYRRRTPGSGGTWSIAANAGSELNTNFKRWIRLEAQLNSDSILVGFLTDTNNTVGAMIWDGSTNTFGNQLSDAVGTSTASATDDEQAFDIAWETSSGTPMLFWGTTGNNLVQREFSSGSWQAETSVATGFTNDVDWVAAAADPSSGSNNIALATQEGTACVVRTGVWTGSTATMNGTTYTCTSVTTNNLVDAAFENNTGQAVWALIRSTATTQISWFSWTSGGGFTAATTEAGTHGTLEGVQLYGDLNTESMMLLYHEGSGNCQLWHREWDGSSWSAKNANPLYNNMCAAADNDTMPYGFGFDRNLETLAAYRWFTANNGVSVSTALTSQDTPYTLTTANQQFRLRLLLYYPDSLIINGRAYKLQYVDPGTGTCASPTGGTPATWTDVSTSTSDPISFHNNATPADGDNLTENVSLDPTYQGLTRIEQDYEESNTFTNSVSAMSGDQVGEWDFSLVDNTTYDRNASAFCFRVVRDGSNLVLQTPIYPQINTAALADVLIQGGSLIQGGTLLQ